MDEQQPSYLDFARVGRSRWWWYLLGTIVILVSWQVVSLVFNGISVAIGGDTWLQTALLILGFLGLFFSVLLVTRLINGRPWRSVITPYTRFNWGLVGRGALFWGVPLLVTQLLTLPMDSDGLRLTPDLGAWILLVVTVVLLVGLQTTAEELFFRGYLLQWVSLASRSRWIIAVASAVLFTIPHLANPEVTSTAGSELAAAVLVYALIGFTLGWVSVVSGTIELAIGAHFINNVASFTLVSPETSVAGSSLIVDASPNVYLGLGSVLVTSLVFMYLTRNARGSGVLMPELATGEEVIEVEVELEPAVEPGLAVASESAVVPERVVEPDVEPGVASESAVEPESGLTAAGWYADPSDESQVRWWDGEAWTHHTQDKPED